MDRYDNLIKILNYDRYRDIIRYRSKIHADQVTESGVHHYMSQRVVMVKVTEKVK